MINNVDKKRFSTQYIGRYAPSPTGRLHLGNLRTALLAWLHARLNDGIFLLRFDDLDTPRVVKGSDQQIINDLQWLGLDWDGDIYYQSENIHRYQNALSKLSSQSRVYPCFCSRKDIQQAVSAPHTQLAAYPGTCRYLSQQQRAEKRQHKKPALRYRVDDNLVSFVDLLYGNQHDNLSTSSGDFVIKRADGLFAYQLAVVIDDITQNINTVVRGADLQSSSARQVALFDAFDSEAPTYMHVPLLMNRSGERMAKRDGSDSVSSWQKEKKTPQQLIAYLAKSVGLIDDINQCSAKELLDYVNLESFYHALLTQRSAI